MSELTYSNPRKSATFTDWPYGQLRTTCTFEIEKDGKRGERATRVTINPKTNEPSAPKLLTFAARQLIVDGSDGRTYIATKSLYGHISIMQSNMQLQQESIFPDNPRFAAVNALFSEVP
jgi:hypothetical protein